MAYTFDKTGAQLEAIVDGVETFDNAPTSGSDNPVTSDGINTAVEGARNYALSNNLNWNTQVNAGSITPSVTLPSIGSPSIVQELRYIFEAATANASFTAPTGVILTDGESETAAAGTIAYTDLTAGSIYECSFVVLSSTKIGLIMKEWPDLSA